MTARPSMAALISKLRILANDTTSQIFSDDQLQAILDQRAVISKSESLTPLPNILPGGTISYTEFVAVHNYFDDDAQLRDIQYNPLTPATADFSLGYFTFSASQSLPVLIYGRYYDINGAAADAWDIKAAKYADGFDFSADGASFSRSQRVAQAERQARLFRANSFSASAMTIIRRTDVIE